MSRVRCPSTLNLLDWVPPQPAVRFDDPAITMAATRHGQYSRAMSAVLSDVRDTQGLSRQDVADRIKAFTGEDYTLARLNADTAESKTTHIMNPIRLEAFCHATNDDRIWSIFLASRGKVVIDSKYVPCIEAAILAEQIKDANDRMRSLSALVRGIGR